MSLAIMVAEGSEQVEALQSQISELNNQMHEAQAQLDTIALASRARADVLGKAQAHIRQLEAEHKQVSGYARLKHGKTGEKLAVKDTSVAKKALDEAKSDLAKLEQEQAEASRVDATHAQELQQLLHKLQHEKEARLDEIQSMQSGLGKAKAELGIEKHAQFVAAYREKESQLNALLDQVVAAKVELLQIHETALNELTEWPALRKEMASLQVLDDANSRMIESTIHYIEAILAEVPHLRATLPRSGYHFLSTLLIPEAEIINAKGHPEWLRNRIALWQQRLEEYRGDLANGDE
jgi:DNA repair exonuclease SbcCD ATPase subunit